MFGPPTNSAYLATNSHSSFLPISFFNSATVNSSERNDTVNLREPSPQRMQISPKWSLFFLTETMAVRERAEGRVKHFKDAKEIIDDLHSRGACDALTWSSAYTPTFRKDYKNLSKQNQALKSHRYSSVRACFRNKWDPGRVKSFSYSFLEASRSAEEDSISPRISLVYHSSETQLSSEIYSES